MTYCPHNRTGDCRECSDHHQTQQENDALRSRLLEPGYVPTMEDVAEMIDQQGQWGKLPTYIPCPDCGFPVFENVCEACNRVTDVEIRTERDAH